MSNNPLENIWDEFTKTSEIEPSIESLIAEFFNFLPKLSKNLFWVSS